MMKTSVDKFSNNFKKYINKVIEHNEALKIKTTKDNGVVIISLAEYNSMMATHHELSSRKNEKRLDAAIEKLNSTDI